ncbi:MAG: rod shape-determining protein MreC [Chloroflexota bacterium]|nr:rod shape-determining protein MreC [Chloroflexota bacterium]
MNLWRDQGDVRVAPVELLVLLILLTFAGMALNELGYLEPIQRWILRLLAPPQRTLASITGGVSEFFTTLRELGTLRRENEVLRELADKLMIENVRLKEAEAENEELRRLLKFTRANPRQEYRAAEVIGRVIGRDPSSFLSYLTIDVGEEEGIETGMPVVTDRGLVGRVAEAGLSSSKVLLIIDARSSVNALFQSTRASGMVEGVLGGGLVMKYVSQDQPVSVGDVVLTSGLGGNFPKGLVIGQVLAVHQRDVEMFQQAQVQPTVDFSCLERVLVITGFPVR